jgi:transcriptional regulator with XRE-family HTH domain
MPVEHPIPNKRLQRARLQKGWKQERLAAELGVAFETVSRWERGEIIPSPLLREQLCRVFDASLEELGLSWNPEEALSTHPPPALVLISSSAEADHAFVMQLIADYQAQGMAAWSPRTVKHLDTAQKRDILRKAIRSAELVVVIASPSARSSRDVRAALELASLYRRPVCAVWIAGEQWQTCFPKGSELVTTIDARTKPQEIVFKDIMGMYEEAQRLSRETAAKGKELLPPPAPSPDESAHVPRNPYKGLKAFHVDDQRDFFGRDQVTGELITLLADALHAEHQQEPARLIAVLGPSGSGKSSVVMAGVLPRLQSGQLAGSEHWVYLDPLVPDIHPLQSLAQLLAMYLPERRIAAILEDLEDDSARGLHLLASSVARPPRANVLLVVDQCEELFALATDETERQAFIDLLVTAATEPHGPVIVILILRADFSDRLLLSPDLGSLIQKHSSIVLPMDTHDLRAVIEKPASHPEVQLTFEGNLVGDLLFEAHGQPGALPLLEFTLEQLFQQRDGHRLTLAAYRQMGGVKGALVRQAEMTYAALPSEEHRTLARALFLRMIDPGMTEQDTTRRRVGLAELSLPDRKQTTIIRQVVDAFIAARLLTTNEIGGITTVEVSHEALIREWPRIAKWLREGREDIRLQQILTENVAEWEQRGRPKDWLYRGSQLKEAHVWSRRNIPSSNEVAFLNAGALLRAWSRVKVMAILLLVVITTGITLQLYLLAFNAPNPSYVSNLKDQGPGSLRGAIDAASSGSTIVFAPTLRGIIVLSTNDLAISKNLTVRGPGANILTISNDNNEYSIGVLPGSFVSISGLGFKNSELLSKSFIDNKGELTLISTTISGNRAYGKGSSINNSGMLTIIDSTISNNTGNESGGINNTGTLTITDSTISDNSGSTSGGVNNSSDGTLTITGSTITGNTTQTEGGGVNSSGTLDITNSTISDNKAYGKGGGGIYNNNITLNSDSSNTLVDSTISGNMTTGNGGGIDNVGLLSVINSTVSANKADGWGGGISSTGPLGLTNSTISDNTAFTFGGGIAISYPSSNHTSFANAVDSLYGIDFCTIYGNTTTKGQGGGIAFFGIARDALLFDHRTPWFVNGGNLQPFGIGESIVAGNQAYANANIAGLIWSRGYNLFQNVSLSSNFSASNSHPTDLKVPTSTNLGINPLLGKNDGLTQTHALLPGSPAIDHIPLEVWNNVIAIYTGYYPPVSFTTDQRGMKRPDENEPYCDIGAYEYSS